MQKSSSKRDSALLLPTIAKTNHSKSTRERDFPNRVKILTRRLFTMGELYENEIEMISIYTNPLKHSLSTFKW
jgi:hypothetical protein